MMIFRACMARINAQFPLGVNPAFIGVLAAGGTLAAMTNRKAAPRRVGEVKIPPNELYGIVARLNFRLRQVRQGHDKEGDQAFLAAEMGLSKPMVNRMLLRGAGSFAAWRLACKALDADMHYIAFGLSSKDKGASDFSELLQANQAMARQMAALKAERDALLDQITKLKQIG